jgi:hypothetical protein
VLGKHEPFTNLSLTRCTRVTWQYDHPDALLCLHGKEEQGRKGQGQWMNIVVTGRLFQSRRVEHVLWTEARVLPGDGPTTAN